MPTEHEFKYVIDSGLLTDHPESAIAAVASKHIEISQGYLAFSKGMSCRIRSATMPGKKTRWYFTFKQKVSSRVIEIEKKINQRDGEELWPMCVGKLKKDRYELRQGDLCWELDLFKKDNGLYFLMAEVELPEGHPRPKNVHPLLKNYVRFEVPLTDDRFSNKKLGDVEYAQRLYLEFAGK